MRRHDREMTDRFEMEPLLTEAKVCRFGCDDNGLPYIVPLSFGYREGVIYIHSAHEGRKSEMLKKNPACYTKANECKGVMRDETPCKYEMHYRSVIYQGRAYFVTDPGEKQEGLDCILQHYVAKSHLSSENELQMACVLRIEIAEITGKKYGD